MNEESLLKIWDVMNMVSDAKEIAKRDKRNQLMPLLTQLDAALLIALLVAVEITTMLATGA